MNPAEPMPTNTNQNPLDLNEKVFLKNKCTIPGFESIVIWARTHRTMMMGYHPNIMTQAPYVKDQANSQSVSMWYQRTLSFGMVAGVWP